MNPIQFHKKLCLINGRSCFTIYSIPLQLRIYITYILVQVEYFVPTKERH